MTDTTMQRTTTLRHGKAWYPAWYAVLALYIALVGAWLLIGLAAALTAHDASVRTWAGAAAAGQHGTGWTAIGRGLMAGAASSYPTTGVVLDYVYSAISLLIVAALLEVGGRDRAVQPLALGVLATAGAFNLQAHAAADVVASITGTNLSWLPAVLLNGVGITAIAFGLLLFTDGKPPWQDVRNSTAITATIALVLTALGAITADSSPTIIFVFFFGLLLPVGIGAVRGSRLLLRSVLAAVAVAAVLLMSAALITQALKTPGLPRDLPGFTTTTPGLSGPFSALGTQIVVFWILRFMTLVIPSAVLFGAARYRPSAELVFNRALIYTMLIAAIGGLYVLVVVRVDAWFGLDSDWLAPPQVAAAGLAALAFYPARAQLERWADRFVFGRRITPTEALTQTTALARTAGTGPDVPAGLARIIAQGLKTGHASVYLAHEDGTRKAYTWPPDAEPRAAGEREIPVSFQGRVVGALGIPPTATRRRALPPSLTRATGLLMHNVGLATDLERQLHEAERRAEQIRASRWRIVAAQDAERRDLERDLHDGAQPGLTAVRLSLGLAAHQTKARTSDQQADRHRAHDALVRLRDQIDEASINLRQTLRGLAPAALDEHGVGQALRELAESLGADPAIGIEDGTHAARFAADVEAAVYFCCAEALQNAAKHCPGAVIRATITLRRDSDRGESHRHDVLAFAVIDDGPGFDAAVSTGSGMQNMADRIAAVGGNLRIESATRAGTTVSGTVPASPPSDAPDAALDVDLAADLAG